MKMKFMSIFFIIIINLFIGCASIPNVDNNNQTLVIGEINYEGIGYTGTQAWLNGKRYSGIEIKINNFSTNQTYSMSSGINGSFSSVKIPAGDYIISSLLFLSSDNAAMTFNYPISRNRTFSIRYGVVNNLGLLNWKVVNTSNNWTLDYDKFYEQVRNDFQQNNPNSNWNTKSWNPVFSAGWFGVSLIEPNMYLKTAMGLDLLNGAFVSQVFHNSPGENAGIRPGDFITSIDGNEVQNAASLTQIIKNKLPGDNVMLNLIRDSLQLNFTVKLDTLTGTAGDNPNMWPGLTVLPLTDAIYTTSLNLANNAKGVYIEQIYAQTPAAAIDLQRGDLITGINGISISDPASFYKVLRENSESDLWFDYIRNQITMVSRKIPGTRQMPAIVQTAFPAAEQTPAPIASVPAAPASNPIIIPSNNSVTQNVSVVQKYALVIGNGAYSNISRLTNPVNDANDMTAVLQNLGFVVDKLINASQEQMDSAVIRLKNRLSVSENSYSFIFYAGHGVQSNGENFLIPVDANIPDENYLKGRAVSVQIMLDELNDAGNALNVVVLDACRDNPFGWARSGSRGLTIIGRQPAKSIIVFATSAGSTASDGTGRNGLFTSQLLNNLVTPGLDVSEIFRRTGADVVSASGGRQIPAVYSQFFGTAVFGEK
ncbi:MAG: caspase family protein [Treponema sp.]|nr:caspase family protein [Treponema sp.]